MGIAVEGILLVVVVGHKDNSVVVVVGNLGNSLDNYILLVADILVEGIHLVRRSLDSGYSFVVAAVADILDFGHSFEDSLHSVEDNRHFVE